MLGSNRADVGVKPAAPKETRNGSSKLDGLWTNPLLMAAARRIAFIGFVLVTVVTTTLAQQIHGVQDQTTLNPPPKTVFSDWKEVASTDFTVTYEVQFESAYDSKIRENDRVKVTAVLPSVRSGPVPVVILLHYWGATDNSLELAIANQLTHRGMAAVIMPLPYHLSRTPRGYRSGELAIQPDTDKLIATTRQSLLDVRRTLDWIETKLEFNKNAIGISGTSLGSIISALTFGIDDRIKASSFALGGVDLSHILWHSSAVVIEREALRRKGLTEEKMTEILAPVEPLNYLPGVPDRPTLVIGARHDTIIPNRATEELIQATGSKNVVWLDSGHYGGFVVQSKIEKLIVRFFDAVLHGQEYKAPNSVYTPTIRVGAQYNGDSALQVAGGIDLWRYDAKGTGFASALLTPKGVQGYLGYKINRELSFGLAFTRRKTTWGLFWSVVL